MTSLQISWRFVTFLMLSGLAACGPIHALVQTPKQAFSLEGTSPAPDYATPTAWLAYPGRSGLEREVGVSGQAVIDEATAPADVFFIHPTTYKRNDVWNVAYDMPGEFDNAVLLGQASVFNGCCRIFAPQYRQATIYALDHSRSAVDLAYRDVAEAFRYYIAHENHGRPFIIAAHSQGSMHAVRLIQQEVLETPLKSRMVAAYVIGAYVPSDFADIGLPVCDEASQIHCVVSWNASQVGRKGAFRLVRDKVHWWRGQDRRGGPVAVCVNPLIWRRDGEASPASNAGSLPFPQLRNEQAPIKPQVLVPHLTGAVCRDGLLEVDVSLRAPPGFQDVLSLLYGSYHLSDYGLFYAAIRENVAHRIDVWAHSSNEPDVGR